MLRDVRNRRRFESLENRLMLASDTVTAVVTNHNLTIVGDGKADAYLVTSDGTPGDVVIMGFVGSDGNQTLINGSPSVTLHGATGNVTMLLGNGNVTASVADLIIGGNLTMTGGNGNETIDIGTDAAITPCTASTDAVFIGANLTIVTGNGNNAITVGETIGGGTDVNVLGTMTITAGRGSNHITELSLGVTGSEAITLGNGANTIAIGGSTVAASGVSIGKQLVIVTGSGGETITEESLTVGATEAIALGSGSNSVTLGAAVTPTIKPAVHAAAIAQVVADGGVEIGSDLITLLGGGNSSFSATNVQVGDTILILGGLGFGFNPAANPSAGNLSADANAFANPLAVLLGSIFGHASTDTITLSGVTAKGVGIFTGIKDTDIVNIQGSNFDDLGVGLGTGAGSLSVGTTTTFHSTTFVGLGNKNTYHNLGGNSFTKPLIIGFV